MYNLTLNKGKNRKIIPKITWRGLLCICEIIYKFFLKSRQISVSGWICFFPKVVEEACRACSPALQELEQHPDGNLLPAQGLYSVTLLSFLIMGSFSLFLKLLNKLNLVYFPKLSVYLKIYDTVSDLTRDNKPPCHGHVSGVISTSASRSTIFL